MWSLPSKCKKWKQRLNDVASTLVLSSLSIILLRKRNLDALVVLWLLVFCVSSSRCRGLIWSLWSVQFLVIFTFLTTRAYPRLSLSTVVPLATRFQINMCTRSTRAFFRVIWIAIDTGFISQSRELVKACLMKLDCRWLPLKKQKKVKCLILSPLFTLFYGMRGKASFQRLCWHIYRGYIPEFRSEASSTVILCIRK